MVAVTAAMTDGTGLKRFHNMFPERFFDVGIAEQHAVTFASRTATAVFTIDPNANNAIPDSR